MSNYTLDPPVVIRLASQGTVVELCPYECQAAMADIDAAHKSESEHLAATVAWLAKKLEREVTGSEAVEFRDFIITQCGRLNEERKKKLNLTPS